MTARWYRTSFFDTWYVVLEWWQEPAGKLNKRGQMLNQISMWQMVIDLCLVTSILVMTFRMAKASRVQALLPRVAELEARVTKLISEAEAAARGVHDQLIRREQNLTRYLSELETKERQMSTAFVEGESLAKELSLMCETARRETEDLAAAISEMPRRRTESAPVTGTRSSERKRGYVAESKAVDEFQEDDTPQFSTRARSRRASEWLESEDEPDRHIEVKQSTSERSSVQRLNDLYQTAENMLKNGKKPNEVSEKTKLPYEGVKRLAEMIEIEREEKIERQRINLTRSEQDARLGALAASRRPGGAV